MPNKLYWHVQYIRYPDLLFPLDRPEGRGKKAASIVLTRVFDDIHRIALVALPHLLGKLGYMFRHTGHFIVPARHRLAKMVVNGDHAGPDAVHEVGLVGVLFLVARPADADLAAATDDLDLEDRGRRHLGGHGRDAGVAPAVGDDAVGDGLHGPELLLGRRHDRGVAVDRDGAVVDVVRVRGQAEDEAVDFCRRDGHGEAFVLLSLRVVRARRRAGEIHQSRAHVPVHVNVQRFAQGGGGVVETRGHPDHGQRHGERVGRVRSVEGDVDISTFVDDGVDGFEVVCFCPCQAKMAQVVSIVVGDLFFFTF